MWLLCCAPIKLAEVMYESGIGTRNAAVNARPAPHRRVSSVARSAARRGDGLAFVSFQSGIEG